jgi:hypothetical protein
LISSIRSFASSVWIRSLLPCVTNAGPSSRFNRATSAAASWSATEPVQVRDMVERVATYFVVLLNSLAMESSSPPSAYGQCAAKIS